jgi:hypothetical protein
VEIFEEEACASGLGCILQLSMSQKSECFETVCVTKVATAVNRMMYNMFSKQAAAVIAPSSHEVSFPHAVQVLKYLLSTSVVAGHCGVLTQA